VSQVGLSVYFYVNFEIAQKIVTFTFLDYIMI